MKIKILISMLFLVIFFLLCKKETPTAPAPIITNLHIEGLVTEDGRPVIGFCIELMQWGGMWGTDICWASGYTDNDGLYCIKCGVKNCDGGFFLKVADHQGYYWNNLNITGDPDVTEVRCTEKLQIIDIEFENWKTDPSNCYPELPNPNLIYNGSEDNVGSDGREYTHYYIGVTNSEDFPDELFKAAPHLPPCGKNTNASRSWVDIFNNNYNRLYGFCGLEESENLKSLWFAIPKGEVPPASVYIQINDRECNIKYTSNLAPIIE